MIRLIRKTKLSQTTGTVKIKTLSKNRYRFKKRALKLTGNVSQIYSVADCGVHPRRDAPPLLRAEIFSISTETAIDIYFAVCALHKQRAHLL